MTSSFKWLNITQFAGALIDNAFKMLTVIYLVSTLDLNLTTTLTIASGLLVLPFLLFSNAAGAIADRYSKRNIIIAGKWTELGILLLAYPALLTGAAWPAFGIIFLLATQSAFFGPAKRGIIPELVTPEDLSRANGYLTGATYLAIILGLFIPSLASTVLHTNVFSVLTGCVALSIIGVIVAYRIAPTPAAQRTRKPSPLIFTDALRTIKTLRSNHWLFLAFCAEITFSGITAFFQQNIVTFASDSIGLSVEASGFLFPLAAIGIAIGALLTGRLSKHAIEVGLIPVGAAGLAISVLGLSFSSSLFLIGIWLIMAGIAAGMFAVPLNAYIQQSSPADRRGEIYGAIGFFSFAAMVVGALAFYLLRNVLHLDARSCMFITGLTAAIPALLSIIKLPDSLFRLCLTRLTKLLYRIRFSGIENLPSEGGALLVCNHISYADGLVLQAATQRPIRYVMSREIFGDWKWCQSIFKLTRAIPIHTKDGPRQLVKSLETARQALRDGSIVCIFPEGELTKNGNLMTFHKGFEKIAKGTNVPIIPAHLGNLWGSIFSFFHGHPGLKRPTKLPYPVSVRFGHALPTNATADDVRQAIAELGADYATEQAHHKSNTLPKRLLTVARHHWNQRIFKDTLGQQVTYGKLLSGSVALNNRLKGQLDHGSSVGILLPSSVPAALANTAITLQGRTVVNLNWTVSHQAFNSAIQQSNIKQIITSRHFLEKIKMNSIPAQIILVEDLLKDLSPLERLKAYLAARFASARHLAHDHESSPENTACVIFSSGSTGQPKGIMLSHANLLANIDALQSVSRFTERDTVCGILPLFHSFGYLGTFWWPLMIRARTVYHPNPLQATTVIHTIRKEKLSTLLCTPTFLQAYMRRATSDDFTSLKNVITGGEKLLSSLACSFESKFNIRPLEGYGATELSPIAALSIPDTRIDKFYRQGTKTNSVGHPLPGVAVRIIDPDTLEPLTHGKDGLLQVKGPNVMQGYLKDPGKTAEVLRNGWYNTGDIAHVDQDGFVFLTDRLSRFSKIAGEMIPHGVIETAIKDHTANTGEPCIAVVSIQDETKGEQLAVCFTAEAGTPQRLIAVLKQANLPNLWIPRLANFVHIERIPLLGTGKLDFNMMRRYASEQLQRKSNTCHA